MRDPDLPLELFSTCTNCGADIPPHKIDSAPGYAIKRDDAPTFTRMQIFCSADCGEAAQVVAVLEVMNDDGHVPTNKAAQDNTWCYVCDEPDYNCECPEDDEDDDDDDDDDDESSESDESEDDDGEDEEA